MSPNDINNIIEPYPFLFSAPYPFSSLTLCATHTQTHTHLSSAICRRRSHLRQPPSPASHAVASKPQNLLSLSIDFTSQTLPLSCTLILESVAVHRRSAAAPPSPANILNGEAIVVSPSPEARRRLHLWNAPPLFLWVGRPPPCLIFFSTAAPHRRSSTPSPSATLHGREWQPPPPRVLLCFSASGVALAPPFFVEVAAASSTEVHRRPGLVRADARPVPSSRRRVAASSKVRHRPCSVFSTVSPGWLLSTPTAAAWFQRQKGASPPIDPGSPSGRRRLAAATSRLPHPTLT